jgi:hypothetical protein
MSDLISYLTNTTLVNIIYSKLYNILAQRDNELVLLRQEKTQMNVEVDTQTKSIHDLENQLKNMSVLRGPPGLPGEKGAKGLIIVI